MLVAEIVYDTRASKIKLTLRPLPDLGFQVEGDKVSFDERTNWLPGLFNRKNLPRTVCPPPAAEGGRCPD